MGKKEKLIKRLKSNPKDFTFDELQNILNSFGFKISNKGKTSGSAVKFIRDGIAISLHKPHKRNTLLEYQVKDVIEVLERNGLL